MLSFSCNFIKGDRFIRCSGKIQFSFSGKWQTAKYFFVFWWKFWCWAQKKNTVYILWPCCWCCFRRRNKNNKKKKNNDENGIEKQEGKCCLGVILSRKGKMKKKIFHYFEYIFKKKRKNWKIVKGWEDPGTGAWWEIWKLKWVGEWEKPSTWKLLKF